MADTRISNAAAQAMLNALTALYDAGSGAGYIEIRTGSAPAELESVSLGTLLGTLPLNDPAFAAATDAAPGASASANPITGDADADADGTAGHFRAYDSDGNAISQGDITGVGGGGDMEIDNTSVQTSDTINVNTWVLSMPEQ